LRPSPNLDVSNVDSIEKVYRVLTKHLKMTVRKLNSIRNALQIFPKHESVIQKRNHY